MRLVLKIVIACTILAMSACTNRIYPPAEVFMFNPYVKTDVKLQRNMLQYGRLLKPEIMDNRLVSCELSKDELQAIPEEYLEYVSEYVTLVNDYLATMSEQDALFFLEWYKNWSVDNAILSMYMNFSEDGRRMSLDLDLPGASDIGIDSLIYSQTVNDIERLNNIRSDLGICVSDPRPENNYTSIFAGVDIYALSASDSKITISFRNDLKKLNENYK